MILNEIDIEKTLTFRPRGLMVDAALLHLKVSWHDLPTWRCTKSQDDMMSNHADTNRLPSRWGWGGGFRLWRTIPGRCCLWGASAGSILLMSCSTVLVVDAIWWERVLFLWQEDRQADCCERTSRHLLTSANRGVTTLLPASLSFVKLHNCCVSISVFYMSHL